MQLRRSTIVKHVVILSFCHLAHNSINEINETQQYSFSLGQFFQIPMAVSIITTHQKNFNTDTSKVHYSILSNYSSWLVRHQPARPTAVHMLEDHTARPSVRPSVVHKLVGQTARPSVAISQSSVRQSVRQLIRQLSISQSIRQLVRQSSVSLLVRQFVRQLSVSQSVRQPVAPLYVVKRVTMSVINLPASPHSVISTTRCSVGRFIVRFNCE